MGERTLNWGSSESDAKYQTRDTAGTGGDFVVVENLDTTTNLLEWDDSASEWLVGGPLELGSDTVTTTGTVTAGEIDTGGLTVDTDVTTLSGSTAGVALDVTGGDISAADDIVPDTDGTGSLGTSSKSWGSVRADEVNTTTQYVHPSQDLDTRISNGPKGKYILLPNDDGTKATYTKSDNTIPAGYHVRGQSRDTVALHTADPVNDKMMIGPQASVGEVLIADASDPGNVSAGDERPIGVYANNRPTSTNSFVYWPGRELTVRSGEPGLDRPSIAGIAFGTGDGIYARSTEGNAGRFVADDGSSAYNTQWFRNEPDGSITGVAGVDRDGWFEPLEPHRGMRHRNNDSNVVANPDPITLSDTGTAEVLPEVSTNQKAGFLLVRFAGDMAMFHLRGGNNQVQEALDPNGSFSTTQGADGTVNVYYSGTQYEIENQSGSQRTFTFWFMS